jgi:hypothetical protein
MTREEAAAKCATDQYCNDDVELDDDAITGRTLSVGDDGVWVRAWLWVSNEEIDAELQANGDDGVGS